MESLKLSHRAISRDHAFVNERGMKPLLEGLRDQEKLKNKGRLLILSYTSCL